MPLKSISGIIFLVKNLDRAVKFYENLGFEIKTRTEDVSATAYVNWFWIEFLAKDKVVTESFKEDIRARHKGAGSYLHISVEDVDEFYEQIRGKGYYTFRISSKFPLGTKRVRSPGP